MEFSCAIPREQIVGVGKRRFLMKRALVGIVPDELLNRKRRAPPAQDPAKDTPTEWTSLGETRPHVICSSVGIVDPNLFLEALQKALSNEDVPVDSLKRALFLEFWLRHLANRGVLAPPSRYMKRPDHSSVLAKELSTPDSAQKFS